MLSGTLQRLLQEIGKYTARLARECVFFGLLVRPAGREDHIARRRQHKPTAGGIRVALGLHRPDVLGLEIVRVERARTLVSRQPANAHHVAIAGPRTRVAAIEDDQDMRAAARDLRNQFGQLFVGQAVPAFRPTVITNNRFV